jgi:prepilin-type processing-associated H-X9-DG protein
MSADGSDPRPMTMAEVRRPGECMQFGDGYTDDRQTAVRRGHGNGQLNGAFLDGHARRITELEWNQVGHDGGGYHYRIAAADR